MFWVIGLVIIVLNVILMLWNMKAAYDYLKKKEEKQDEQLQIEIIKKKVRFALTFATIGLLLTGIWGIARVVILGVEI